tara:strand:+ start:1725 stop:2195 length:471 start_codon:yes stop_codon:yes gene_type:complete
MTTSETAQEGNKVSVHYVGTITDTGEQFDSSRDRNEPISFVLNSGEMISGFNDAVIGLSVGETTSVTLAPDRAYGDHRPDANTTIPLSTFPDDMQPSVGMPVPLRSPDGQVLVGKVSDILEESVTVDLNHPLAGKTISFEIELVSVENEATANETE